MNSTDPCACRRLAAPKRKRSDHRSVQQDDQKGTIRQTGKQTEGGKFPIRKIAEKKERMGRRKNNKEISSFHHPDPSRQSFCPGSLCELINQPLNLPTSPMRGSTASREIKGGSEEERETEIERNVWQRRN